MAMEIRRTAMVRDLAVGEEELGWVGGEGGMGWDTFFRHLLGD